MQNKIVKNNTTLLNINGAQETPLKIFISLDL